MLVILRDGPHAGRQIDIPEATPTLILTTESKKITYERLSWLDDGRHVYSAADIVERTKTPVATVPKARKKVAAKKVANPQFKG